MNSRIFLMSSWMQPPHLSTIYWQQKWNLCCPTLSVNLSDISPSDHEEADTCMMLHMCHTVMGGHMKAFLWTVDSDVILLAVHLFTTLKNLGPAELWICFRSGKTYTDFPVHEVSLQLGTLYHAFTGCDVTSSMLGIGKKSGLNAWMDFPEVTDTMLSCIENPQERTEDSLNRQHIEHITVLMYIKNCTTFTVNEAQQLMFTHCLSSLESNPPTKPALYQHVKRTILVSYRALEQQLCLPDPAQYGWEWNERLKTWAPYWTELGDANGVCALMIHCTCTKACKSCKCCKAWLRCAPLRKYQSGCCKDLEWGDWAGQQLSCPSDSGWQWLCAFKLCIPFSPVG